MLDQIPLALDHDDYLPRYVLEEVRNPVLPAMYKQGPMVAWIVQQNAHLVQRLLPSEAYPARAIIHTISVHRRRGVAD